jgi:TRAP-type uncharacterized transport system fused permease subunit
VVVPEAWPAPRALTLFAALVMTGVVCILMGCGIPTTANYIIMVTVAAPTLVQLGVEPLVAHFFVFYYGVLADITPPVALAAYAAAGMAGSDPFKTGNTAFRLGMAKVLVPFVFVFSPSLLLVAKGFTWYDFTVTFFGCVLGITVLAAALSRFFLVEMKRWEQVCCASWPRSLLMIAPGLRPRPPAPSARRSTRASTTPGRPRRKTVEFTKDVSKATAAWLPLPGAGARAKPAAPTRARSFR